MHAIRSVVIASSAILFTSAIALADDTTTTTTTTQQTEAPQGVTLGVPGVVGVQIGGPPVQSGCTSKHTTTTNDDTGTKTSTTSTNC